MKGWQFIICKLSQKLLLLLVVLLQLMMLVKVVNVLRNDGIALKIAGADVVLKKRQTSAFDFFDFGSFVGILVGLDFDEAFDVEFSLWFFYWFDGCLLDHR